MKIIDALRGLNAYPIPPRFFVETATKRGLTLDDEATEAVIGSSAFILAKADTLMWLALAPDVSQGGQSFSFSDEQRKQFRLRAMALYDETDTDDDEAVGIYGYKGTRL